VLDKLKYIFPAGCLLKSTPNTFVKKRVKKSEIEKSGIFSTFEGVILRADLFHNLPVF